MSGITQFDDVTLFWIAKATNGQPEAVAAYGDGSFANIGAAEQSFPHALMLGISTNGSNTKMRCSDSEQGDLTIQGGARYGSDRIREKIKPVQYCSASNVQAMIDALQSFGHPRSAYFIWSAHYTNTPHVCGPHVCGFPQADGTQWTCTYGGMSLDCSLLLGNAWFAPIATPQHTRHYERYSIRPVKYKNHKITERAVVEAYDHLRIHPQINHVALQGMEKGMLPFLRKAVWYDANYDQHGRKLAKANWNHWHLTWRWNELDKRSKGQVIQPTA